MDKELEELSKQVPKCMKKRPVGRPVVKQKFNSFYTNYYSTKAKECK